MAKLGELGKIITGNTPKTSDAQNYESNDICFVKPSDFRDNEITEIHQSEFYISAYAKDKARVLPTDSILVTCIGIIGKVAINKVPCAFNQQINAIVPEKKVCNPRYIAYAIQNLQPKMQSTANAAVVPILNKTQFSNLEVPLLPVGEQKQIACNLNKIDKLISLRKQQLAKLDELVKARFVEMFGEPMSNPMGWKRVRFDSISENLDSKRVPVTESDRKDGIYPYYGASGIVDWINDYIFDEDILLVSEDGANLLMRSTPIAFSVSGKSWVNNHAHVVRFHDFATQKFIEVYFSLIDISEYITGTAQPKLNQAKLNAMLFCWPPLALQNQFAAFVERVDQQKQTVQQSLDKLELMKKALMQEYFG
ncbi:restriction endonuclease subunit S [Faecalibacterium prausnitzii]|uniref:restriction endonuclease subunit S n=1 Tax=Faecalibacterium prausnitzii TaxID=853 RepID=UPI0022E4DCF1|nr:restriction endonuclease subunit S [Faecalibacterium prausnitzii]